MVLKKFTPGRGYTEKDWDAVDSPELTDEQLSKPMTFEEAFPGYRRSRGRPKVAAPKAPVTLRLDPAETADPAYQPDVTVFLNRQQLAHLRLSRDPERVGSYRIRVGRDLTRPWNRLDLVASHLVRAGESGVHYSALPPETPVAFRLWYVRLEPAATVVTAVPVGDDR